MSTTRDVNCQIDEDGKDDAEDNRGNNRHEAGEIARLKHEIPRQARNVAHTRDEKQHSARQRESHAE